MKSIYNYSATLAATRLLLVLTVVSAAVAEQKLFSTKLLDGELWIQRTSSDKQIKEELVWQHANGSRETLSTEVGWSIEAAIDQGEKLALVRAAGNGRSEYWYLVKQGPGWAVVAKAVLDPSPLIDEITFDSLDSLRLISRGKRPVTVTITSRPRGGDPVYRHTLKDGIQYTPPGIWIGSEIRPRSISSQATPQAGISKIDQESDTNVISPSNETRSFTPDSSSDSKQSDPSAMWWFALFLAVLGLGFVLLFCALR